MSELVNGITDQDVLEEWKNSKAPTITPTPTADFAELMVLLLKVPDSINGNSFSTYKLLGAKQFKKK